jgi:RnfABCDGE-type electron transport complex B subunit
MNIVIITVAFAFGLSFVLGVLLGVFKKVFAVPVDPRLDSIRSVLPGANCGACGFPGCDGFAENLVKTLNAGEAPQSACTAGGPTVAAKLDELLGTSGGPVSKRAAFLGCRGGTDAAALKGEYVGERNCRAAKISAGGTKLCSYGCIGFGDCVPACVFGALSMGDDGLPVVNLNKCTGCGACVHACPQGVLSLVDADTKERTGKTVPRVRCSNHAEKPAGLAKICKAACIKCGLCVKNCPQGAVTLEKGLPQIDTAKCLGVEACGICMQKCPTKALDRIIKE